MRRPLPRSTARITRSSVCAGFSFSQWKPRWPAAYGASSDFAIRPSWPGRERLLEEALGLVGVARHDARQERAAGDEPPQPLDALGVRQRDERALAFEVQQRRRRTTRAAARGARPRRPCCGRAGASSPGTGAAGRPARSASASPSTTASRTGSARAHSTTSGTRAVTSCSCRVKTRTSSPARWTCSRAPSSLYSKAASPSRSSASSASPAGLASIGATGESRRSEKRPRPAAPSSSAARASSPEARRVHRGRSHVRRGRGPMPARSPRSRGPRALPGAPRRAAARRAGGAPRRPCDSSSARSGRSRRSAEPGPVSAATADEGLVHALERQGRPDRGPRGHRGLERPPADPDAALRERPGEVEREQLGLAAPGLPQERRR